MISDFALEEQARHLQSLCTKAEIEINGVVKPMNLTSFREGKKVRFFIEVPATEVGEITKRMIKSVNDQVCWSDPPGGFYVVKDDTDLLTEIPIDLRWKVTTE